jgi:hypothetical protein
MKKKQKPANAKEFATLRGVSEMSITRWRRRGLIVSAPDGGIDVEASNKLLDERPETYRGGKIGGNKPSKDKLEDPESLARSIAIKEEYLARRAKLTYEREAGRLFDVERGARMYAAAASIHRNTWLGMGVALAPRLVLLKTADEMKACVDEDVARRLEDLSHYDGNFDEEFDQEEADTYAAQLQKLR